MGIWFRDSTAAKLKKTIADIITFLRNMQILAAGLFFLLAAEIGNEAMRGGWEWSIFWRLPTWISLSEEIGFALIIAFLISAAIERAATREFHHNVDERMKEIQRQVFRSTYGRNVPPALIDEVELLVLQANFLRHGHRLTYNLEMKKASELANGKAGVPDISVIVAEVNMSYELENISSLPEPYKVKLTLELPPFDALKEYVQFHSVGINGELLTGDDLKKGIGTPSADFTQFERTIPSVLPGQRMKVKATWQAIKAIDDVELWRSVLPSDGMTLCVRFPKEAKVKGANALHRSDLAERTGGYGQYREWAIDEAVLPHQGIVFWWRCSEPAMTQ